MATDAANFVKKKTKFADLTNYWQLLAKYIFSHTMFVTATFISTSCKVKCQSDDLLSLHKGIIILLHTWMEYFQLLLKIHHSKIFFGVNNNSYDPLGNAPTITSFCVGRCV